jgi:hypothetical protein
MWIDWSKWFAMSKFSPFIVLVSCLWVLGMRNIKPTIVVTYEIRVFFKGAQKQVFSSILKFENVNT